MVNTNWFRFDLIRFQHSCVQRNLFEILLYQTEFRLYFLFSDWFGTNRTFVWFQINLKMVNTIWFLFDSIRFRKYCSVRMRGDLNASAIPIPDDWNGIKQWAGVHFSGRLTSIGIIRIQWRALLKSLWTSQHYGIEEF